MRSKFVVAALSGLFMAGVAFAQSAPVPVAPPADPQNILNIDLSTGGRVKLLLRPDKAPYSVERIKTLTRRHFYDGLIFHRVIDGFMAQGGDPKGTGEGGSDLPDIKAEFNDLPHVRGTISLARAEGPDTANSQFFIMLMPNLNLDGSYTAIGRVLTGMEYVDAIEKGEPPEKPSKIVRMSIESDELGQPAAAFVPPPPPAPVTIAPATIKQAEKDKEQDAKREKKQAEEKAKEEKKKAKRAEEEADEAEKLAKENAKRAAKGSAPAVVAPAAPVEAAPPPPVETPQAATDAAVQAVTAEPSATDAAVQAVTPDEAPAQPQ
ncbi:MAG: peptidylprolyl isomerase [Sphingomonadales bacterium]|nr:MAG: peptidylprolyl isomerase [Sphingomonadales bacterium]